MNFGLSDDLQAVRGMVRDLARAGAGPDLKQLGELGLLGVMAPEEHAGSALGLQGAVVVLEELASRHPSVARRVQLQAVSAVGALLEGGSAEQQAAWVERLATGAACGSFGADSDDGFVRGVGFGAEADLVVGIGAGGFTVCTDVSDACPPAQTLGLRESGVVDVRVARREALLDAPKTLLAGNVALAAIAVGIARGALEHGAAYAQERKQFGQAIARFQAIQWKIADSATAIDSARVLVQRAAWLHDAGKTIVRQGAMARLAANRAALLATDEAVQIHGGYGYVTEFPVEALYRDARAVAVLDGVPDVHKDNVAGSLIAGVRG